MSALDELIVRYIRERLKGDEGELALRLYMAYKEGGRKGVLRVIEGILREIGVEAKLHED